MSPSMSPWHDRQRHGTHPWLLYLTAAATFAATGAAGISIRGYSLTAIGWCVPLVAASFAMLRGRKRRYYPLLPWLPWAFYVTISTIVTDNRGAQRSIILLCPILVAWACSYRHGPSESKNAPAV
jgi:hypothetical protein